MSVRGDGGGGSDCGGILCGDCSILMSKCINMIIIERQVVYRVFLYYP